MNSPCGYTLLPGRGSKEGSRGWANRNPRR